MGEYRREKKDEMKKQNWGQRRETHNNLKSTDGHKFAMETDWQKKTRAPKDCQQQMLQSRQKQE